MSYRIQCAYVSHIGNIRVNNEDNFWCMGDYLNKDHVSSSIRTMSVLQSDMPVFAVFDGMGGESRGEVAAYLATQEWNRFYVESKSKNIDCGLDMLLSVGCVRMDQTVSDFAEREKIGTMGTTVAMIGFGMEDICICNVGDSRIYHQYDNHIKVISTDHIASIEGMDKTPLTQYVGIKQNGIQIVPALSRGTYHKGDKFLICSDGLSDVVSKKEILKILNFELSPANAVRALLRQALAKGGNDNITIVLCHIENKRRSLWEKIIR